VRRKRIAAAAALAAIAPVMFGTGVALAAAGSGALTSSLSGFTCQLGGAGIGTPAGNGEALTPVQVANAQIIYEVAVQTGLPQRAAVIAIATAKQESDLINSTTATDHDSLGLFQQRPSQGWGTPAQVTDPVYAARAFYQHLVTVPGWQTLPLTQAAQDVQHSAYPSAYAQWETLATRLVATFDGQAATCAQTTAVTATTLGAAIVAYAQKWLGTPYQYGGGSDTGPTVGDNSRGDGALGFDCSGLTMYAVYQATHGKVSLNHYVADQYADPRIQHIAYNQLQPGDLVFLDNLNHVGIYTGHQTIIDAPDTGAYVRYDSIAPGTYFYQHFVGGGRVIDQ
jgi:cell wall-associated NlpC family hydrolase